MFSCITLSTGNDIAFILFNKPGCSLFFNRLGLGTGGGNYLPGLFSGLGKHVIDRLRINGISRLFSRSNGNSLGDNGFSGGGFVYRIKGRPGQQTGFFAYLGDGLFPLNGHDMDTGNTLDLLDLIYNVDTYIDAFLLFIDRTFHPVNDFIGHVHARNEFFHIAGHPQRFRRGDTGQDMDFFIQPHITAHFHEFGKFFYVVDDLCLNEIGPGSNLFAQTDSTKFKGIGKRVGGSSKEKFGCGTFYLFSTLKFFRIPHVSNHTEHLDGIHIKDTF